MTAWRACQIASEDHVVDETWETWEVACKARGPMITHMAGSTVRIACPRCREVMGDLRRGGLSYETWFTGLTHRLEPVMEVVTGPIAVTREAWALRCNNRKVASFTTSAGHEGLTTCLECLALGERS